MPFVVGIYEMQAGRIDAELAQLFEDVLPALLPPSLAAAAAGASRDPGGPDRAQRHGGASLRERDGDHHRAKAWAVTDCICRKQQALLGQPCEHPLDVCMVFSQTAGAFDQMTGMRALSQDEALATLRRAAEAGLVHSVSNTQEGLWYLCNCCTCACGILRGLADLGMANVIAPSAFSARWTKTSASPAGTAPSAARSTR